jgi:hypothetical protein
MTIEQTIDIPEATRHLTVDLPEPVPAGKAKVALTPLSEADTENFFPHKPPGSFIFSPDKKPRMTPQEALDWMSGRFKGSKFTVDKLLAERREDLEMDEEKYRRRFRKE